MMSTDQLKEKLDRFGQLHVLSFWESLDETQRQRLGAQIEAIDLPLLDSLIAGDGVQTDFAAMAAAAEPPPAVCADGSGARWGVAQARERGEEAIRAGEVGAVLVAGGQGTRLGFEQPKGMFPIGPVTGRTLFQCFADRLRATSDRYGVEIPLYLMTSDATDEETVNYFRDNQFLGLSPSAVRIFRQGTMPAIDAATGKLLMASRDSLALSPDGHGGTIAALDRSGCLADAAGRGVRHLSYIQVDNPLAALCDPVLLGHHLLAESEMTTQVVRKTSPEERVGNVVSVDGRVQIIEYSDLPTEAAEATDGKGNLRLWAGNIAVHVFDADFLGRAAKADNSLPFHRAHKAVPFLDGAGRLVRPDAPNATKFERFVFDLLPQARNALVVEARPAESFAPVKNADGAASDTPKLSREAISRLHRSWLREAGAVVDEGVSVEINPRFALDADELKEKIPANLRIDRDRYFDV